MRFIHHLSSAASVFLTVLAVSCVGSSNVEGNWISSYDNVHGIVEVTASTVTMQTMETDRIGNVIKCSYSTFPYTLKKNPLRKRSKVLFRSDDQSLFAHFYHSSEDSLVTSACVWVRPDSLQLIKCPDFMLHEDMSWLKGTWQLQDKEPLHSPVTYYFDSDNSFHTGTLVRTFGSGLTIPGVFFISDGQLNISYGNFQPGESFAISSDRTLSSADGRLLTRQ